MNRRRYVRWLAALNLAFLLGAMSGCGGGGGSSAPALRPPPPPPLSITTTSLPNGITGQSYTATLQTSGGAGAVTWSIAAGNLPSGLSLSSNTSEISGTPSSDGEFNFTVQARDSASPSQTAAKSLSINIIPALAITTESLPDAIVGESYSHTLQATGGTPPYIWSWTLISGSSPPGLSLSSDGTISGTPLTATEGTFRAVVGDADSNTATRDLRISVLSRIVIETESLPDGDIGVFYSSGFAASGGQGSSLIWSITSGRLPEGLILDSGNILGTPTEAGTFDFTIKVEGGPQTLAATKDFSLFIDNQVVITTEFLPDGVTNEPYSGTITALGGTPPYTWGLSEGRLPNGLELNPTTGEISGTPIEEWINPALSVQVEDSSMPAQSATSFVRIRIRGPLGLSAGPFPAAIQDVFYQQLITGFGGRPPYSLQVTSGSLPDGLSLAPHTETSFRVDGKPTTLGEFPFALELIDSSTPPAIVRENHSITVVEQLIITTENLPEGLEGNPYSAKLTGTGGAPPYEWQVFTLPKDLVLDSATGEISGTPKHSVDGTIQIVLRDSGNDPITKPLQQVTKLVPIKIIPRLFLTTRLLPPAVANANYKVLPGVTGGVPPYTWSVSSGSLPDGLTLDPGTGEISGILPAAGSHEFTLRVTDSGATFPQTAEQPLILVVADTLERNDSTATATPLSNGTYRVSISPYADPADTVMPDSDYYKLTAAAGSRITLELFAERSTPPSQLDPVIEIVAADGTRFQTCRDTTDDFLIPFLVRDVTPSEFDDACINDDNVEIPTLDSKLEFLVPDNLGDTVIFFVHVLDFRGDARPEFVYEIKISGTN